MSEGPFIALKVCNDLEMRGCLNCGIAAETINHRAISQIIITFLGSTLQKR